MDARDPQVREELARRLRAIDRDESDEAAHAPLPAADLWALVAIVVVALVLGALAGA